MIEITTDSVSMSESFENISFPRDTGIDLVRTPIISDQTMAYVNIYMHFLVCGSLALFGTVNNVINMHIFHTLGLKDSMGVSLMALSLTDFLVSFLSVVRIGFFIWDLLIPDSIIDPLGVNHVSIGWWRDLLFLCSAWITTFLSVERCVCVVSPFKVKDIFTKTRAVVMVVAIYVVTIAIHMPVFLTQWLGWTTVQLETDNGTIINHRRLVAQFAHNRKQVQLYIDIANGAVLPMPSQVLVLISVIWMVIGLKLSSQIRNPNSCSDKDDSESKKSNLTTKERRLVKVVLFLAIILTFCNIPRFIAVYAKQIFPDVSFRSSYGNLYMFLWNVSILASIVNSSVNICVYMIVNKSYRQKFKEIFHFL